MTPDDIMADMQAGTPGPWAVTSDVGDIHCQSRRVGNWVSRGPKLGALSAPCGAKREANARRIARVPFLEQAYLDDAAQIAALEAQLADGSFYKETDIDAMQDRIKALEARVRELERQVDDAWSEYYKETSIPGTTNYKGYIP